jgi:hypothetical protein
VHKRFGRGSLGAILWLIGSEVDSLAMEKKDGGEERSIASLWVALLSMQSSEWSGGLCSVLFRPPPYVGSDLTI